MRRFLSLFLLPALFLLIAPVHACLNDRDTLGEEIKGLPDVVQVITGRFERNPALYYQMRVARISSELNAHPIPLSEYDDAGVACDRLGNDDAAIAWMANKQAQIVRANAAGPAVREQWYRYNANLGTFWVHRWIRAGADRRRMGEVQKARGYIAEAIKIKPDAHFGREKYQLQVMEWILSDTWTTLPDNLRARRETQGDAVKGLSGLIMLGSAWESVDVFAALRDALPPMRDDQLRYLAGLRCQELIDSGHKSLMPDAPTGEGLKQLLHLGAASHARLEEDQHIYHHLRAEADAWQKKRTDYMMARLTARRHPDTDPTFWNDYHDPGPPHIGIPLERRFYLTFGSFLGMPEELSDILWLIFLAGLALLARRFWLRRRKRQPPRLSKRH